MCEFDTNGYQNVQLLVGISHLTERMGRRFSTIRVDGGQIVEEVWRGCTKEARM